MATAKINDIEMYYEEHGDADAEPVLLIMGFVGNALAWAPQIPSLSEQYRVIAFDNRGAGRSGQPAGAYTIPQMADDAAALLGHLGVDAAHIVGASMGGMIAQEFALRHPQRVRTLSLLCTTPGGPNASTTARLQESAREIMETESLEASMTPERIEEAMLEMFSPEFIANPNAEFALFAASALQFPATIDGMKGQFQAILAHDTYDRLPQIAAPTLVLAGDTDPLVDPQDAHILADRIPGAQLQIFPRMRHGFNFEAAGGVNGALLQFIGAHAGVAA